MNAAIAGHLNVIETAILEVREWAYVLWVRVAGIGCRFVSKKVIANAAPKSIAYTYPTGEKMELLFTQSGMVQIYANGTLAGRVPVKDVMAGFEKHGYPAGAVITY